MLGATTPGLLYLFLKYILATFGDRVIDNRSFRFHKKADRSRVDRRRGRGKNVAKYSHALASNTLALKRFFLQNETLSGFATVRLSGEAGVEGGRSKTRYFAMTFCNRLFAKKTSPPSTRSG